MHIHIKYTNESQRNAIYSWHKLTNVRKSDHKKVNFTPAYIEIKNPENMTDYCIYYTAYNIVLDKHKQTLRNLTLFIRDAFVSGNHRKNVIRWPSVLMVSTT